MPRYGCHLIMLHDVPHKEQSPSVSSCLKYPAVVTRWIPLVSHPACRRADMPPRRYILSSSPILLMLLGRPSGLFCAPVKTHSSSAYSVGCYTTYHSLIGSSRHDSQLGGDLTRPTGCRLCAIHLYPARAWCAMMLYSSMHLACRHNCLHEASSEAHPSQRSC